ncbi:Organic cation/carnitine transporter 7 [Dichanthelium oligosanthes]|uniref:Organic cation/carnitine transporter 7 n=1 Tax=Dichanthelium oligosanthes TaxID=888268 RepID=A0A1E5W1S3_9POAL|nr:Organic cation/carnitine transporter 7 [Dichanthelium oligosanthes]
METYTTDDVLTAMGFGKFQAFVLAYAGMGSLAEAMEVMLLSFLGPAVRDEWNVSPQDESLLSSVVFAGMLIGACAWGFISDRYGRRNVLLLSTLLTSGLGFLSALSPNYLCLMALRFFVGIGVGSGHAVLSALSWRWLLALTALPCFLLLPFFRIIPESPRYLCAQNRMTDARLILERMANANQASLPLGVLTYHRETETDYIAHISEDEHLIPVREKEHTLVNSISSKFGAIAALRKLLSHNLLKSTLLLWFVYYTSIFAYYGIALLTSQLSDVNRGCSSDLIFEVQQNDGNLYKDTFITSLAGRIHQKHEKLTLGQAVYASPSNLKSQSGVLAANMETYTTDDALTMMGFGRSQALVLVYAGMGWVAESMELMLLSFLGPFIRREWDISPQNESMLSSIVFAGMLLGACAWGFVSDKYGRRYGFVSVFYDKPF